MTLWDSNAIVQVPETLGRVFTYPTLIFNDDWTVLVKTETIIESTLSYSWHFPDLDLEANRNIDVVFIPMTPNSTDHP
jgi:hypothetical protein